MQDINDIIYIWENGRVIQTDYMVGNTKSFYTIYEYDEQNNVILKKEYDIVSSTEELLLYKTNYTYNQNNDLIENRTTIYYHPNDWWPEEDLQLSFLMANTPSFRILFQ